MESEPSPRGPRPEALWPTMIGGVIKYHFHAASRDVPRLEARKGDRLCHVYSDRSLAELIDWGQWRGYHPQWIDRRHVLAHYDVPAASVSEHEPGVERAELVRDIRGWRARNAG